MRSESPGNAQSFLDSVAAARFEFVRAGIRLLAAGTAADRKAGERDAKRWSKAGAVTVRMFRQARYVRLTTAADAILRQLVGVPTVGQSRDVLRLVAKPPAGALLNGGGVCEWSLLPAGLRDDEFHDACRLLADKLAALLAAGMIRVWPDTCGLQAIWTTQEGHAELRRRHQPEPKPPELKARQRKRLANQYRTALEEQLQEREHWQRDAPLAIPLSAGTWSRVKQ
jgi:hypothetical protein